jgi:hypothetical protein
MYALHVVQVVRTEMTDSDVPDAKEWAVLAAPFILNLGDAPAKEDFNGTSVVRSTHPILLIQSIICDTCCGSTG